MLTAAQHMHALHVENGLRGRAALAVRAGPGRDGWHERQYDLDALPDVAARYAARRTADVYASQHRFRGWRRIILLVELGACWVDLDVYRAGSRWVDDEPEFLLDAVLAQAELCLLPPPSYVVATGRGLAATWLPHRLPAAALPRWMAAQKNLATAFRGLCADRAALDGARVLRVVGTTHSRAADPDTRVRLLWPADHWPERHSFERLADALLPYSREQLADLRATRRARRVAGAPGPGAAGVRHPGTLWKTRLDDLMALVKLREVEPGAGLPSGRRDIWLLIAASALAWLAPPPAVRREVLTLARVATGGAWTDAETQARMSTVIARAEAAGRGETVRWGGGRVDPRYRWTSQRIVEVLDITPHEQAGLKDLVDGDEKRRRKRLRDRRRAAEHRAPHRTVALDERRARDGEIRRLHAAGHVQAAIAATLGVSQATVSRVLEDSQNIL